MKSMHKKLAVLLAVLLISCFMAACANGGTAPSPAPANPVDPAQNVGAAADASIPAASDPQEPKVFTAATPGIHYPWNFMEDGELKGIDIAVLDEVGRRIGYEVEYEIVEFSGLFGLVDNGKADTGACQITVTPVRLESYTFSDNYAFSFYKLAVREDDNSINSMPDLVGKTFISQPSRVEAEIMEKYISDNGLDGKINLLVSDADPFMEISLNRADATFYPELMFTEKNEEGQFNLKLVGDVVGEEAHAFPFRKDVDPEFLAAFNSALAEMREDGFLADLFIEYFGTDISRSAL